MASQDNLQPQDDRAIERGRHPEAKDLTIEVRNTRSRSLIHR